MSQKLKPCPFDGGAARLTEEEDEEVGGRFVCCTTCSGTAWGETPEQAAAAWNDRIAEKAIDSFLPKNLCLDNPNIPDDMIVGLDVGMGELRALAAISKESAARG